MMKLNKLIREDKHVSFTILTTNEAGHEESQHTTAHEAPHPEMDRSLEACVPVVKRIMEFNTVQGITVHGVSVSYTKHGTRSASLHFRRLLNATMRVYQDATPLFKIDDPAQGENGERECEKDEAVSIVAVIEEGLRYAGGERQQVLLPLEDPNAEPKEGKQQSGEGDGLFPPEGGSAEQDQDTTPKAGKAGKGKA